MITLKTAREIIQEISDEYGLPDEITTIFYNKETGKPIGYNFDDEGEPFIFVDMCDDLNKIWQNFPDACSWDGWEDGIIGNVGPRLVYNVEKAQESYLEKNNDMNDITDVIEHWEYNVEGTRPNVPCYCRPYHMYELYN